MFDFRIDLTKVDKCCDGRDIAEFLIQRLPSIHYKHFLTTETGSVFVSNHDSKNRIQISTRELLVEPISSDMGSKMSGFSSIVILLNMYVCSVQYLVSHVDNKRLMWGVQTDMDAVILKARTYMPDNVIACVPEVHTTVRAMGLSSSVFQLMEALKSNNHNVTGSSTFKCENAVRVVVSTPLCETIELFIDVRSGIVLYRQADFKACSQDLRHHVENALSDCCRSVLYK